MSVPRSFAAECGNEEINSFLKSPRFQKLIRPAKLDSLGAGIFAVPVPGNDFALGPMIGIRVGGELFTFRESEMLENIVHRIKVRAGVASE